MSRMPRRIRKAKRVFRRQTAPGAMPGTVAVDPTAPRPAITMLGYGPGGFDEQSVDSPAAIKRWLSRWSVTWVNIDGLGDADVLRQLGTTFNIHPLALEDIVNVHQRPKVEEYADSLFVVAHMLTYGERLDAEQISLFLGPNFVVTFQERPGGDVFDPVRQRLRRERGRLRGGGSDVLLYSLLDAVIDAYFPVLEQIGERLDLLDDLISTNGDRRAIHQLHDLRSELLQLRRAAWPLRDAMNVLVRDSHPLIADETRVYLRDCHDHTVQIIDVLEMFRDTCTDVRDVYFSQLSQRTNDVMRVLTIISTIFIPLSFIAGIYGMNFDTSRSIWNMPELHWPWGYPFALGLMTLVAGGFLLYFWRKGWLRS